MDSGADWRGGFFLDALPLTFASLLLLSMEAALLLGVFPLLPPSGLSIHQELFPVASLWTLINLLCRDRLCLIEFWKKKKTNKKTNETKNPLAKSTRKDTLPSQALSPSVGHRSSSFGVFCFLRRFRPSSAGDGDRLTPQTHRPRPGGTITRALRTGGAARAALKPRQRACRSGGRGRGPPGPGPSRRSPRTSTPQRPNRPREGLRGARLTRCGPAEEEEEEEERPPGGPADSCRPPGLRQRGPGRHPPHTPRSAAVPLTAALGAVARRQPVVVGLPRLLQRVLRELPRRRRRRHPRPPPGSHCSGGGRGGTAAPPLSSAGARPRPPPEARPGAGSGRPARRTPPRLSGAARGLGGAALGPECLPRGERTEARGGAGPRRRPCSLTGEGFAQPPLPPEGAAAGRAQAVWRSLLFACRGPHSNPAPGGSGREAGPFPQAATTRGSGRSRWRAPSGRGCRFCRQGRAGQLRRRLRRLGKAFV